MKLSTLDIAKLFPVFMREDSNFKGIIYALEPEFQTLTQITQLLQLFQNIDNLPEDILDELAYHFNIIEYNNEYSIDVKRSLIKGCLVIHHQRGTVSAVEQVGQKIFGDATVEEWFDYEETGQPYHFKVYTSNISTSDEMIADFRRMVKSTQNIRSYLDEIVAETINEMPLYFGGQIFVQDIDELRTGEYVQPTITTTNMYYVQNDELYFDSTVTDTFNLKDVITGTVYLATVDASGNAIFTEVQSDDSVDMVQISDMDDENTQYLLYISNGQVYYS